MAIAMSEIEKLSIRERIQLVEDIWDTIASSPDGVELSQAQKDELDRRISECTDHPDDGSSWEQVKRQMRSAGRE